MVNELRLFEKKNQILVSSRVVAEKFEKNHFHVLRDIERILGGISNVGDTQNNYFIRTKYTNEQNRQEYPEFLLTKKGFLMYVFSFQGNESFKMAYISEFERMELLLRERQSTDWLKTRKQGKLIRREETDIIQKLIPYAENQGSKNANKFYLIYSKLVNKAIGIESGQREFTTHKNLMVIALLEDMISKTIEEEIGKGVYYKEIYQICKNKVKQLSKLTYLTAS